MLDGRLYRQVDWPLIAAILVLCAIGVAMIYSTTFEPTVSAVGPQAPIGGRVFAHLGLDNRTLPLLIQEVRSCACAPVFGGACN